MHNTTRGITLIETMIYIALFGVIMTGAVVAVWQVMEAGRHNETNLAVQEEGTFLIRKIAWVLTGTSNTTTSGSSTLTVTRPDLAALTPSQSPITLSATGTRMMLARGASPAVSLNSDAAPVTNVVFIVSPAVGTLPTSVTVSFSINDKPFVYKTYVR